METRRVLRVLAALGVLVVTAALAVSFCSIVTGAVGVLLQRPIMVVATMPAPEAVVVAMEPETVTLPSELPDRTPVHLMTEVGSQGSGIIQKHAFSRVVKSDESWEE